MARLSACNSITDSIPGAAAAPLYPELLIIWSWKLYHCFFCARGATERISLLCHREAINEITGTIDQ